MKIGVLRAKKGKPLRKRATELRQTPPPIALSVRQPWAWAIIHGGKDVENRSLGAIRSGNMDCRRIAVHAATGLTQDEYDWGVWRLDRHGVACPRPDALVRGAIIGSINVVGIVTESESDWFGGRAGLLLRDPSPCPPIPAAGALGYFTWERAKDFAAVKPWMRSWGAAEGGLFETLPTQFKNPPARPWPKDPRDTASDEEDP